MLALFDLLRRRGETRVGLVTPYTSDVQQAIVAGFAREGVTTVSERHSGLRDNFSFAEVSAADLVGMIEAVAADRPDAIVVLCTNLAAAPLVAESGGSPRRDDPRQHRDDGVWRAQRGRGRSSGRQRIWGIVRDPMTVAAHALRQRSQ